MSGTVRVLLLAGAAGAMIFVAYARLTRHWAVKEAVVVHVEEPKPVERHYEPERPVRHHVHQRRRPSGPVVYKACYENGFCYYFERG